MNDQVTVGKVRWNAKGSAARLTKFFAQRNPTAKVLDQLLLDMRLLLYDGPACLLGSGGQGSVFRVSYCHGSAWLDILLACRDRYKWCSAQRSKPAKSILASGRGCWLVILPPPWPSWHGKSGVQSFDLDGVGSIPAILPTQFTCFIDEFNKLA
jgi:hypothetical protein